MSRYGAGASPYAQYPLPFRLPNGSTGEKLAFPLNLSKISRNFLASNKTIMPGKTCNYLWRNKYRKGCAANGRSLGRGGRKAGSRSGSVSPFGGFGLAPLAYRRPLNGGRSPANGRRRRRASPRRVSPSFLQNNNSIYGGTYGGLGYYANRSPTAGRRRRASPRRKAVARRARPTFSAYY